MKTTYAFIDNVEEVLERLGGNTALLDKLLGKFIETYADTGKRLDSFLREALFEEAHRLVHSVKGVSGNLGFARLYESSLVLEQLLKSGTYTGIDREKEAFLSELERVVGSIESRIKTA